MGVVIEESETPSDVGARAPDFILEDVNGEKWQLSDTRGRVVALLFYPRDETLVCTKQMCAVRDHWADYVATGAEIVGISPGTIESHQRFAEHHNLPLPLLADVEGDVTRKYTEYGWLPSWATRALVVVDAEGFMRCRKVMLRVFRPDDKEVILAIRLAQIDILTSRWKST